MTAFELLKTVHVSCALLSVTGFALRGAWLLLDHPWCRHRLTRTVPHVVDTLLLCSAIGMLWIWQVSALHFDWLRAKLIALLLYILLGVGLMRFARTSLQRLMCYVGALLCASYMLAVATTHSPWGLLATVDQGPVTMPAPP